MSDFIKVLRYGYEVEEAPTREMLSTPKESYTKSLWSVRALEKKEQEIGQSILSLKGIDAALWGVKSFVRR